MSKRGKYFADTLSSFSLGSPEVAEYWRVLAQSEENNGNDLVVFSIPQKRMSELIVIIEKILYEKLGS